ncbi:hypothetical protein GCM10010465_17270 [Actinomadura fibrosa]
MCAFVLGCSVEPLDPNLEENLNSTVQQSQGNPHDQFGIPVLEQGDASENSLTVNIIAGENGATGGLSVRWMTSEEFDEFGWDNGMAGHVLLNGHANDAYSLANEGDIFPFHLENFITGEGESWNRALSCDQSYVFIVQAHQDGSMQKSDYSDPSMVSTLDCDSGGDDPCDLIPRNLNSTLCLQDVNNPTLQGFRAYYNAQIFNKTDLPVFPAGTYSPPIQDLLDQYESSGGIGSYLTTYTVGTEDCGEISVDILVEVQDCAPGGGDDPCDLIPRNLNSTVCLASINNPTLQGFRAYFNAQISNKTGLPVFPAGTYSPPIQVLLDQFQTSGGVGTYQTDYTVTTEDCGEITVTIVAEVQDCNP